MGTQMTPSGVIVFQQPEYGRKPTVRLEGCQAKSRLTARLIINNNGDGPIDSMDTIYTEFS